MTENVKDPEIVFFFGAGASVEADVPDTYAMASQFIQGFETDKYVQCHKSKVFHPFKRIVKTLKKWNRDKKIEDVDVEQLLETLEKLEARDKEVLLYFTDRRYFYLKPDADIKFIIKLLKEFIKRKTIVSEKQVTYLSPLFNFIEPNPFQPLIIFSVNYDSCIEQLCSMHKKRYTDGFNIYWSPEEFEQNYDVKLYKIHGSIMWYQTDKKEFVKIPIRTEESEIKLITNESASPLILYPMGKYEYIEPLTEMQIELRRRLEKETTKFVIIVGYSFRDNYIIHMLWDAARKNRDFIILLVNPNAELIYDNKLKYYDKDLEIPSSLEGRVVFLPYEFGKVLPSLKNLYIKNLREARTHERNLSESERRGGLSKWEGCLEKYAECEFASKVYLLENKVNWNELSWESKSRLSFNMILQSASTKNKKLDSWIEKTNKLLETFSSENLLFKLYNIGDQLAIMVRFEWKNRAPQTFEEISTMLQIFLEEYNMREDYLPNHAKKVIRPFIGRLNRFLDHLKGLDERKVDSYIKERRSNYPAEMVRLHSLCEKANMEGILALISQIEREELEKIFEGKSLKF